MTIINFHGGSRGDIVSQRVMIPSEGLVMEVELRTGDRPGDVVRFGVSIISGGEEADRPLVLILREAVNHGREFPDHGSNCACLDGLIGELKRAIYKVIPHPVATSWEGQTDARMRISHLMNAATRYL